MKSENQHDVAKREKEKTRKGQIQIIRETPKGEKEKVLMRRKERKENQEDALRDITGKY